MKPEALRWREAFDEARPLIERGDPASLAQAYERLTLSARAFPDSPIAGECHRTRRAPARPRRGRGRAQRRPSTTKSWSSLRR